METHTSPERLIPVDDLFVFLSGRWSVDRKMTDRQSGASGTFTGSAAYTPHDGHLRYEEGGQLCFGDYGDTAFRRYDFAFPSTATAQVFFDDGRAFHDLDLSNGHWRTEHFCDPDHYDGIFQVISDNAYVCQWAISGPKKDMALHTTYQRALPII
ncbi:MAG: hypothetical protein HOC63_15700 [Rhodospirillales bacterium]|nr:hypothetical protein [Rhodospirillales bacterium]